jgi:hypothetical protein
MVPWISELSVRSHQSSQEREALLSFLKFYNRFKKIRSTYLKDGIQFLLM